MATILAFKQPAKKLNIIFIGDSITHGTTSKDLSPPIYTGNYLRQQNKWTGVNVYNAGVSGYTTVDFLPDTHKGFNKVRSLGDSLALDQTSDLVISIMLGTNDSAIKGPNGSPVSPEAYYSNLKTITDTLLTRYPQCKIVYHYPIWYSSNTHNRGATYLQEGQQRIRLYWMEVDKLVKILHKAGVRRIYKGDNKAYDYFEKNYPTDFRAENGPSGTFYLHPNQKGDAALGQFWAKAISKAIR
ncbi:GDSL-type esterase/lipase family protein [Mucilaginibacter sp. CSA2-8R]|uniref:GDSL-type esterase/lipase family protein n=1 Tax=Mucilaginibacter sp. CSA2-8R TaxID=3141542 RepID=UPI00315CAD90